MDIFTIDRVGGQGDGVAQTPSGAVFAGLTLPGETVRGVVVDGRGGVQGGGGAHHFGRGHGGREGGGAHQEGTA